MILLPLAELGDLDVFLRGGYSASSDNTRIQTKVYDFDREFPETIGSDQLLHQGLFRELFGLTSALVWLHEELRILGSLDRYCAHTDLKPDNILITRDSYSHVGRWMLSDFGISLFDKSTNLQALRVHSIRDVGPRLTSRARQDQLIRGRGPYEPPEVSKTNIDARKCDIWSFGCVISDVMEFGLGGKQAVDNFRRRRFCADRFQGMDDYFYRTKPHINIEPRSRNSSNTEVKKIILDWFDQRSFQPRASWVTDCINMVKKMLVVDPGPRATARETLERLDKLLATHFINTENAIHDDLLMTDRGAEEASDPDTDSEATVITQAAVSYIPETVLNGFDPNKIPSLGSDTSTQITQPPDDSNDATKFIFDAGLESLGFSKLQTHGKAVDIAVSAVGDYVALLYESVVKIYRITQGLSVKHEIPLSPSINWLNVSVSSDYLVVYGISENGRKHVRMLLGSFYLIVNLRSLLMV